MAPTTRAERCQKVVRKGARRHPFSTLTGIPSLAGLASRAVHTGEAKLRFAEHQEELIGIPHCFRINLHKPVKPGETRFHQVCIFKPVAPTIHTAIRISHLEVPIRHLG